jgi:hypothetical protein
MRTSRKRCPFSFFFYYKEKGKQKESIHFFSVRPEKKQKRRKRSPLDRRWMIAILAGNRFVSG